MTGTVSELPTPRERIEAALVRIRRSLANQEELMAALESQLISIPPDVVEDARKLNERMVEVAVNASASDHAQGIEIAKLYGRATVLLEQLEANMEPQKPDLRVVEGGDDG